MRVDQEAWTWRWSKSHRVDGGHWQNVMMQETVIQMKNGATDTAGDDRESRTSEAHCLNNTVDDADAGGGGWGATNSEYGAPRAASSLRRTSSSEP